MTRVSWDPMSELYGNTLWLYLTLPEQTSLTMLMYTWCSCSSHDFSIQDYKFEFASFLSCFPLKHQTATNNITDKIQTRNSYKILFLAQLELQSTKGKLLPESNVSYSCFTGDTPIVMTNGSSKGISYHAIISITELQVQAFDIQNGTLSPGWYIHVTF